MPLCPLPRVWLFLLIGFRHGSSHEEGWTVTTLAGGGWRPFTTTTGSSDIGSSDGVGTAVGFDHPKGIAVAPDDTFAIIVSLLTNDGVVYLQRDSMHSLLVNAV